MRRSSPGVMQADRVPILAPSCVEAFEEIGWEFMSVLENVGMAYHFTRIRGGEISNDFFQYVKSYPGLHVISPIQAIETVCPHHSVLNSNDLPS